MNQERLDNMLFRLKTFLSLNKLSINTSQNSADRNNNETEGVQDQRSYPQSHHLH